MQDMTWKVYWEDFNGRKIDTYNIFNHYTFNEDIKKIYKKYKNDFDSFSEEVRKSLQYCFWSRSEWEIVLDSFPQATRETFQTKKIDVYDQVMMNWDVFIKYVWEQAHKRKTRKNDLNK